MTHIAALQLVERGILGLDDSVYKFLPELQDLEVIAPSTENEVGFTLQPQVRPITLRHMLTHSSGIGSCEDALTDRWRTVTPQREWPEGTSSIIKMFSTPLLCQPGDGWEYGHSIHWLQPLVQRAAGASSFVGYMKEQVFVPLGLKHTSYTPLLQEDIRSKLLRCVRREADGDISACEENELSGLGASITDIKIMLLELLGPKSKLLGNKNIEVLFEPAFPDTGPAIKKVRMDEDTFAKTIGFEPNNVDKPAVNFTAAGALLTEGDVPASNLPARTLTWNGWPNVIWTVNRERGIATLFATQLVPVDDKKTLVHMINFLKGAWSTYGQQ